MSTNESRKPIKAPPKKAKGSLAPKRIKKLFKDIEALAAQEPAESETRPGQQAEPKMEDLSASETVSDPAQMQRELDRLRARVIELEAQLQRSEKPAPVLYEKEQVGFAYKENSLEPLTITTWNENSKADNAIRAPLVATGQTIGTMYVESPSEQPWDPEDESLVNTVAQQASLQIQSLRLLASAERARVEAEQATRRFMHESWASYLDAIHQNERVGYAYDQTSVDPFLEDSRMDSDYQETVKVMQEQVGTLAVKNAPDRSLTDEDKKLIASVASQVAQQVENIRLLADASRARAEAEDATRRLTQQSWQEYMEQDEDEGSLAFAYDQNQVASLAQMPQDVNYSQPLLVRGETIGYLSVAGGKTVSTDEAELISSIATQASLHLDVLRLNEELLKRAAQLQELDRLKSSFLANMSHELRTPLNSILGFSDVMLEGIDGQLTDYMENDLRLIQKNGKHLLHLINDVLDMAKIESGRMNLHPEKFNVNEVLEDVISITSSLANEKKLHLYIDEKSDTDVEIFADVTRVKQVLINLVNNSIKFTEKGDVKIKTTKAGSDKILIAVKDTGIGIPASHLETIFQEFAQVDTSTTRKVGGTGLGLPISRRLIEMHGGRLWAESTGISGEGTTLFIEMPLEAQIAETIEKTTRQ